jgi:hypothetical protein
MGWNIVGREQCTEMKQGILAKIQANNLENYSLSYLIGGGDVNKIRFYPVLGLFQKQKFC